MTAKQAGGKGKKTSPQSHSEEPSTAEAAAEAAAEARECAPPGRSVLIVDDSDHIRAMVRETLEDMAGIHFIEEARDGLEGLGALSKKYFDLVITDVNMPRLDGFKLLAAIKQKPQLRDTMVIVLSSLDDSVDKIKGLTIGANDYVTKPFQKGELQARVTVMFKMKDLQDELQRKNAAMEQANVKLAMLANQDGLTGIPNRRYFFERFEVEFLRVQRLGLPLALLMMDIDHFKSFNDTWGHLSGDEALRGVAGVVHGGIRNYDMLGRYGGEELIAFLPQTACPDALLVAERLREDVEHFRIAPMLEEAGGTVSLTISIGIACWPDIEAESVSELVKAADDALYLAKAGGRNRCVIAAPKAREAS